MNPLENLITKTINNIRTVAQQKFAPIQQNASTFINNEIQSVQHPVQFAKTIIPNTQQSIQNVGQYHPLITQTALKTQPFFNKVGNTLQSPPRFNFAEQIDNKIQNPVGKFVASVPLQYAQGVMNIPSDVTQTIGKTGFNLAKAGRGEKVTPQQWLASGAPLGNALLNASGVGVGKQIIKQGAKAGFKQAIKQGMITGGAYGGAYNALKSIVDNENTKGSAYIKNVGKDALIGAGTGALLGGATGILGHAGGKVFETIKNTYKRLNPQATEQQANQVAKQFARDTLGRFTSVSKKKAEPIFYSDLRESLGLPRNGDFRSGAINLGAEIGTEKNKLPTQNAPSLTEPIIDRTKLTGLQLSRPNANFGAGLDNVQTPPSIGDIMKERYGGGQIPPNGKPPQVPSGGDIPPITNPTDPFYNVNRIGVDNTTRQGIKDMVTTPPVKNQILENGGQPLTFKEVQAQAKVSPELTTTKTRQATLDLGAQALALRNKIADLASNTEHPLNDAQFQEAIIKDKAFGQYVARLLGQRRIVSNPADKTIFNNMIAKILKEGHSTEDVIKAAKGVNFDNADQSAAFYRKFIKATPGDWLDLLRYNSMLSSPNTHINNSFSNFQGTGVLTPIQKTVEGVVDAFASGGSKLIGQDRARTRLAGEGLKYSVGYFKNIGNAWNNMVDVMKGTSSIQNPDLRHVPLSTGGAPRVVENVLGVTGKALEGMDIFFRTMVEGGLQKATDYRAAKLGAASVKDVNIRQQAENMLYRGKLIDNNEGVVTNALGSVAQLIKGATQHDNKLVKWTAKFTMPFINTGTNLAKKGIEHNPILGVANLVGNKDKVAAVSKLIMGAGISAIAVPLAANGRLTFGYPTSQKEKDAFIAAGMQPYAIKIGDKWLSYQKMDPAIGFQLATVAGVYQALEDKRLTESNGQAIMAGLASGLQFIGNQTYFKNVGDFMSAVQGSGNAISGLARMASNYPTQLIPFRATMSWLNRMIDQYQRAPDTNADFATQAMQNMLSNFPGLAQTFVPLRQGANGQPVENKDRFTNALSPIKVTTENPENIPMYEYYKAKNDSTQLKNDIKKMGGTIIDQQGDTLIVKDKNGNTQNINVADFGLQQGHNPTATNPQFQKIEYQLKLKDYQDKINNATSELDRYKAEKAMNTFIAKNTDGSLEQYKDIKSQYTTLLNDYKAIQKDTTLTDLEKQKYYAEIQNSITKLDKIAKAKGLDLISLKTGKAKAKKPKKVKIKKVKLIKAKKTKKIKFKKPKFTKIKAMQGPMISKPRV